MPLGKFLHLLLALALLPGQLATTSVARAQSPPARAPSQAAPGDTAARVAEIERKFEEQRKEHNVPGASLVVVRDDRVVLLKGAGHRDAARALPATPDTLFAIGSCTKAFTAMAAVISQDEGKLSLDDPPKKHLPYFRLRDPEADAAVKVRDLLSHASGLAGTDIAWYTGVLTREEVIRAAGRAKPTAKLREKYQYQNVMYSAAGEVGARAQNSTWASVVSHRILRPLGMKATVLSVAEMRKTDNYSLGYEVDAGTKQAREVATRDLTNIAPAGSINSSAREMAEWLRLLDWKTVYKSASIRELTKVEGDEAYVLVLVPERGQPVTEYVSAKTFLVLRRDIVESAAEGGARCPSPSRSRTTAASAASACRTF